MTDHRMQLTNILIDEMKHIQRLVCNNQATPNLTRFFAPACVEEAVQLGINAPKPPCQQFLTAEDPEVHQSNCQKMDPEPEPMLCSNSESFDSEDAVIDVEMVEEEVQVVQERSRDTETQTENADPDLEFAEEMRTACFDVISAEAKKRVEEVGNLEDRVTELKKNEEDMKISYQRQLGAANKIKDAEKERADRVTNKLRYAEDSRKELKEKLAEKDSKSAELEKKFMLLKLTSSYQIGISEKRVEFLETLLPEGLHYLKQRNKMPDRDVLGDRAMLKYLEDEKVPGLEREIEMLRDEITQYKNEKDEAATREQTLIGEKAGLSDQISQFKSQIDTLKTEKEGLLKDLTNWRRKFSDLEKEDLKNKETVDNLKKDAASTKLLTDETEKQLQLEIDRLNKLVEEKENWAIESERKVEDLTLKLGKKKEASKIARAKANEKQKVLKTDAVNLKNTAIHWMRRANAAEAREALLIEENTALNSEMKTLKEDLEYATLDAEWTEEVLMKHVIFWKQAAVEWRECTEQALETVDEVNETNSIFIKEIARQEEEEGRMQNLVEKLNDDLSAALTHVQELVKDAEDLGPVVTERDTWKRTAITAGRQLLELQGVRRMEKAEAEVKLVAVSEDRDELWKQTRQLTRRVQDLKQGMPIVEPSQQSLIAYEQNQKMKRLQARVDYLTAALEDLQQSLGKENNIQVEGQAVKNEKNLQQKRKLADEEPPVVPKKQKSSRK